MSARARILIIVTLGITLVFLILDYPLAQTNVNDRVFDPDPTIPPYIRRGKRRDPRRGTAPRNTPTPNPSATPTVAPTVPLPPSPSPTRGNSLKRELTGYIAGRFTHSEGLLFCRNIAEEVRSLISSGRRINTILVKGFADGIPNGGLSYNRALLPTQCQPEVNVSTLNDTQLAHLRGCIILNTLSGMIEPKYAGGIVAWRTDQYDEPDYGLRGGAYRKVSVEILYE